MAALSMTRGTTATFQLAVTSGGSPTDLTGAELRFSLITPAGSILSTSSSKTAGGPVAITVAVRGLATVAVSPSLLGINPPPFLSYVWAMYDALGNPPVVIEAGTLQFLQAP